MEFGYWEYLMSNLMLPIFGLAFVAVPTFQLVKRLIEQWATGRQRVFWDGKSAVFFAAMLIVAVFLCKSLFLDGGIHLVLERPKHAVTMEGTLETIEKHSELRGIRYAAYGENSCGYLYTVDGVEMTGMAKGTLEAGEQVKVTYLPKSGLVLSVEEQ